MTHCRKGAFASAFSTPPSVHPTLLSHHDGSENAGIPNGRQPNIQAALDRSHVTHAACAVAQDSYR
jgi:hypothetical protein